MSDTIKSLQPSSIWSHFADLNAVPRASKKEGRVIQFMLDFGKSLGLPTSKDETGNVIIKKPAFSGMENRATVILQGHLDMVHQKNSDSNFDFDSQGIDMYIDGDWVRARGTTLGADNGIGVASIMALLSSLDIPHPPIEALFTIDEETGMTGALGLKGGLLQGRMLLNLDTEDDNELTIGCAGGIDVTATGKFNTETVLGCIGFEIRVLGLTGGHSGMDIHKGRGNANKLMNRLLEIALNEFNGNLVSIDGGSLRNVIPRESAAAVIVPANEVSDFTADIQRLQAKIKAEFIKTDPELKITVTEANVGNIAIEAGFVQKLLKSLIDCPNGVNTMSPDIAGLVQTSNNLARVLVKNGECSIQCLTRSSVDSEKMELALKIQNCLESCGLEVGFGGSYPGWAPEADSEIVQLLRKIYNSRFNEEPNVNACHAGLECGILSTNYQGMEMISFGPNIRGAHSPDECVQISSVQKFWGFLLEVLANIPNKK